MNDESRRLFFIVHRSSFSSVSLLAPLLGDRLVILADQPIVARQERLRVGVGVHLGPQRLGQVAPDVLHHATVILAVAGRALAAGAGVVPLARPGLWRLRHLRLVAAHLPVAALPAALGAQLAARALAAALGHLPLAPAALLLHALLLLLLLAAALLALL